MSLPFEKNPNGFDMYDTKDFLKFLKSNKPTRRYDYDNAANCAISQWYRAYGLDYAYGHYSTKFEHIAADHPHTFGALIERIEDDFVKEIGEENA